MITIIDFIHIMKAYLPSLKNISDTFSLNPDFLLILKIQFLNIFFCQLILNIIHL